MKTLGKIYLSAQGFIVDFVQLIIFIVFTINFLRSLYFKAALDSLNIPVALLLVSSTIVLLFIVYSSLRSKIKSVRLAYSEIIIRENIIEKKDLISKNLPLDIKEFLPATSVLNAAFNISKSKSIEWATDSINNSFTLYFNRRDEKFEYSLQMYFYSNLKKLQNIKYFRNGILSDDNISKPHSDLRVCDPFIDINNWQQIVQVAYSTICDHIDNNFSIIITLGRTKFNIYFQFTSSGISDEARFEYYGGVLNRTSMTIPYEILQTINL